MKIAIDIRTAGGEKTGKGWYTFYIVLNLLKIDKKNEYILYAKNGIAGFEEFKNAKLKIVDKRSIFWHFAVARDVAKEKADIFFAPSSYIIPNLLPSSVKTILTVHDLVAFLFPNTHNKKATLLEKLLLKRALKKASHVTAVSQNTKKDIIDKFKYDENKIDVIHCAGSDFFKPLNKDELGTFAKDTNLPEKFFLAVGTIEPRKNYYGLLKAFMKMSRSHPDVHLLIVGQEGWGYEKVFNLMNSASLEGKVHVLGYLSNKSLIKLYNLCIGLVFPSFYEGFGIPPLEAMKCGCPVIASNISSIPEVVGDSAILVNPEDSKEIAKAMSKMIKKEGLREELSKKGIEQAKKFSWENSAKKLSEIFNRI